MALSKVIFQYLTLALEYASAGIIVFGILFSVVFALIKLVKKSGRKKYTTLSVLWSGVVSCWDWNYLSPQTSLDPWLYSYPFRVSGSWQ